MVIDAICLLAIRKLLVSLDLIELSPLLAYSAQKVDRHVLLQECAHLIM
jgi:hypothetical protein